MKKITLLLAVALLTSQFVGCGIFRRVRDHLCRGAYCGGAAPAITTPGIIAPPQTIIAPQPPVIVPQASCISEPCVTCSPVCDPCCNGGLAYPVETGYSGCSECNGGQVGGFTDGGVTLPQGQVFPGPAN